jgi:type I restriction enzyme M protein
MKRRSKTWAMRVAMAVSIIHRAALIKTIVQVVAPKIGDKCYDGALGSAGFLVETHEYLKNSKKLTTTDIEILQKRTLYGKEKKSLTYEPIVFRMIFSMS